jgi:hypothetical protein
MKATDFFDDQHKLTREQMKNIRGGKLIGINCICQDANYGMCTYGYETGPDGGISASDLDTMGVDCCGDWQISYCEEAGS